MFGLLLHHSEFSTVLDKQSDNDVLCRVHPCAMQVKLDMDKDHRFPWIFRGLSVKRVNHVLGVLSCVRERAYKDLNEEDLQQVFTPYDAMPFNTNTENDLFVAYSIKYLSDPFRQLLIGPEGVSLYEQNIPHFGPIYVFKARMEYGDNVKFHMLEIESSVDEILSVLRTLNFGGG